MSASPAPDITRRIWREVTREPGASMETLGRRCQCDAMTVFQALFQLERLGYVTESARPGELRRRVLVPFGDQLEAA